MKALLVLAFLLPACAVDPYAAQALAASLHHSSQQFSNQTQQQLAREYDAAAYNTQRSLDRLGQPPPMLNIPPTYHVRPDYTGGYTISPY